MSLRLSALETGRRSPYKGAMNRLVLVTVLAAAAAWACGSGRDSMPSAPSPTPISTPAPTSAPTPSPPPPSAGTFTGTWVGRTAGGTRVQLNVSGTAVTRLQVDFVRGEGTCLDQGLINAAGPPDTPAIDSAGRFSVSLGTLVAVAGTFSGANVSGTVRSTFCSMQAINWTGSRQ